MYPLLWGGHLYWCLAGSGFFFIFIFSSQQAAGNSRKINKKRNKPLKWGREQQTFSLNDLTLPVWKRKNLCIKKDRKYFQRNSAASIKGSHIRAVNQKKKQHYSFNSSRNIYKKRLSQQSNRTWAWAAYRCHLAAVWSPRSDNYPWFSRKLCCGHTRTN